MKNYKVFVAAFCFVCVCFLQTKTAFTQTLTADTVLHSQSQSQGPRIKEHSPTKATLLSLVPGLGQAYNKQYWKIPVIYAAMGVVTYYAVHDYRGYSRLRTEYGARMNNDSLNLNPLYRSYSTTSVYNLKDSYQSAFELALIIGGVFYIVNLIDACVYAHLFTFNINDDISLQMIPSFRSGNYASKFPYEAGLTLRLRLK